MDSTNGSLRGRVTRQGEEALGKLAQDLLQNPLVHGTISTMFETRERAARVQEVAMGALNLPSASDIARLTRRLRSVSQRIEGLEDGLDRIIDRLDRTPPAGDLGARLEAIEQALQRLEQSLPSGASRSAKGSDGSMSDAGGEAPSGDEPADDAGGADAQPSTGKDPAKSRTAKAAAAKSEAPKARKATGKKKA